MTEHIAGCPYCEYGEIVASILTSEYVALTNDGRWIWTGTDGRDVIVRCSENCTGWASKKANGGVGRALADHLLAQLAKDDARAARAGGGSG